MEENKHLRIIANPYLLKKNRQNEINQKEIPQNHGENDLLQWLSKKYTNISQNDITEIIMLIDDYYSRKIINEFINDIIDNVIKEHP